jgi:hypothetical protein
MEFTQLPNRVAQAFHLFLLAEVIQTTTLLAKLKLEMQYSYLLAQ